MRLTDHTPLYEATFRDEQFLVLYIFEPSLMGDSHTDNRHWRFIQQSLLDMEKILAKMNKKISIAYGEADHIFSEIINQYEIKNIFSHEETGLKLTYERDKKLKKIFNEKEERLTKNLSIIPLKVPHRDEYSETVGFKIIGPNKSALFIPDIDKWEKWDKSIKKLVAQVDYAFLDGTFYDAQEINNRDISEIPHPFIIESLKLFEDLNKLNRKKNIFHSFKSHQSS